MPATPRDPAVDAQFRLGRELAETAARGVLGGVFYVLGWLVVAYLGHLPRDRPLLALGLLLLFVGFTAGRVLLARRSAQAAGAERQLLNAWWALFLVTALVWGGVTLWLLLDPSLAPTRMAAIICTIAYATAYAHTFAMRWRRAALGIALLFLPSVVLSWRLADLGGVAFALTVYLVYLLSALRASRNQYERQLSLELALRHQRDRYELQSRTDALTGLDNRREFTVNLERAFVQNTPLALLVIDIDHFKQINDRHGHAVGDAVLVALAERLRLHFDPPGARLARIGGEEFAVLLEGDGGNLALATAEQLCRRVAASPLAADVAGSTVTVSIGVGQRRRQRTPDEFFAAVDGALYRAKQQGRNRVCGLD